MCLLFGRVRGRPCMTILASPSCGHTSSPCSISTRSDRSAPSCPRRGRPASHACPATRTSAPRCAARLRAIDSRATRAAASRGAPFLRHAEVAVHLAGLGGCGPSVLRVRRGAKDGERGAESVKSARARVTRVRCQGRPLQARQARSSSGWWPPPPRTRRSTRGKIQGDLPRSRSPSSIAPR